MQGQSGFQNFGPAPVPNPEQQAAMDEKQLLRRDVMKCSLLLVGLSVGANLLSTVISLVWSFVNMVPALLSGGGLANPLDSMSGSLMMTFFTGYLPIILVEIAVILVAWRVLKTPFSRILGHNRMDAGFTTLGIFGCVGIGVVGQVCSILLLTFLELIHFPLYLPDFRLDWNEPAASVLVLLYVCLIGPVLEELIFRGFILKALQKHGVSFAVIFSALLFTLFHQNIAQIFLPFLLGVMLALLTIRTGSILPAMLAHIVNNIMSMVLDAVLPQDNLALYWIGYIIYAVIFLGVGLIFLILYSRELTPILKWRSPVIKLRTQLGCAIAHWSTLILIGLWVLTFLYSTVIAIVQNYFY